MDPYPKPHEPNPNLSLYHKRQETVTHISGKWFC